VRTPPTWKAASAFRPPFSPSPVEPARSPLLNGFRRADTAADRGLARVQPSPPRRAESTFYLLCSLQGRTKAGGSFQSGSFFLPDQDSNFLFRSDREEARFSPPGEGGNVPSTVHFFSSRKTSSFFLQRVQSSGQRSRKGPADALLPPAKVEPKPAPFFLPPDALIEVGLFFRRTVRRRLPPQGFALRPRPARDPRPFFSRPETRRTRSQFIHAISWPSRGVPFLLLKCGRKPTCPFSFLRGAGSRGLPRVKRRAPILLANTRRPQRSALPFPPRVQHRPLFPPPEGAE